MLGVAAFFSVCAFSGCRTAAPPTGGASAQTNDDLRFAQALAHYGQGLLCEAEDGQRADSAFNHFAAAARLDPAQHLLQSKLAVTALQRNQPDLAIQALEESCKWEPKSAKAWLDLATAYQLVGRLDDAEKAFSRAIHLAPQEPTAYLALANLFFNNARMDDALDVVKRGLRKTGRRDPFLSLCSTQGLRFYYRGDISDAVACFAFVAEQKTEARASLYYLIGELCEKLNRPQDAIRYFTLSSLQNPPLDQAFVKLALLYYEKSPEKTLKTLQDAERRLPDNLLILLATGEWYTSQNRLADAIGIYDRMMAIDDRSDKHQLTSTFFLNFGALCDRAGMTNKAEEVLGKCLKIHPDAAEVLNYLAYTWAERGTNLDKALDYVQKALAEAPDNGAFVDTLGWIYFKQGRNADALVQLRRAGELMKDDATVLEHIGDALNALNRSGEAADYWKRSFVQNPENPPLAVKLRALGVDTAPLLQEAAQVARQKAMIEAKQLEPPATARP